MGMNLHVAQKYDVKYALTPTGFNYQIEEFHNLLDALTVEYSGGTYDEDFEVDKIGLIHGVDLLLNLDDVEPEDVEQVKNIKEALNWLKMTAEEAADKLQRYIDTSDPDNDWMLFSFY